MKTTRHNFKRILFILMVALFSCLWLVSNAYAATISGTVRNSNGSPITDTAIQVNVFSGDPCEWHQWVGGTQTNTADGTYTITVPNGTYYLHSNNMNHSNYVNEWHTGDALDPSSVVCSEGIEVTVTDVTPATGKNFNLELGGSVAGTVKDSADLAITSTTFRVDVIQGDPCEWYQCVGSAQTNPADGTYTVMGVPAGNFYLHADNMNQSNYVNEWHTGDTDSSSLDCSLAVPVSVTSGVTTSDIYFNLEIGGSVSGTVYQGGSATQGVRVEAYQGDPCEHRQWIGGADTDVNGVYQILGLPAGTCYLQSRNNNEYAPEWYADTESTYYCYEAGEVTVPRFPV